MTVYKDNIGQLIQCYKAINKLTAELGLSPMIPTRRQKSKKPMNKRIAQAQAEGAPSSDDEGPTNLDHTATRVPFVCRSTSEREEAGGDSFTESIKT